MRRAAPALLAFIALAVLSLAGPARAGLLTFAPKAEVKGSQVSLMDLVSEGVGLDADAAAKLRAQMVAPAPAPGSRLTVAGRRLRTLVASADLGSGVSVLIPAQVIVTRARSVVSPRQLEQAYLKALKARLSEGVEADIHDLKAGGEVVVPEGEVELKVRFLSSKLMGRVPAMVKIMVNNRTVAQSRVVGTVDVYGPVVVAARTLERHHVIGPDDLKVVRSNLTSGGKSVTGDPRSLIGLRTGGRIPMGQAIDTRRLERAPLVRRGEVVTMIVRSGGMKVTAKGRAAQTGYAGSRIKLINLASKRDVYGVVLPTGQVMVEF